MNFFVKVMAVGPGQCFVEEVGEGRKAAGMLQTWLPKQTLIILS